MGKTQIRKPYKKRKKKSPFVLFVFLGLLVGGVWLINGGSVLSDGQLSNPFQAKQSQQSFSKKANTYLKKRNPKTINYPLNLQTDERWSELSYGDNTLGVNGCAIATLSMILSKEQNRVVEPTEILDWAKDVYFVEGAGTSWTIFQDFATYYGLPFKNLGNSINSALDYLKKDIPVVVSVAPGEFTDTGHIMILAASKDGNIQVYDPNDTPKKSHYKKTYTKDEISSQVINYWVYA